MSKSKQLYVCGYHAKNGCKIGLDKKCKHVTLHEILPIGFTLCDEFGDCLISNHLTHCIKADDWHDIKFTNYPDVIKVREDKK